ncbi:hypothetical protein KCU89_g71, partial [Aureobasidium melanogenum]
MSNMFSGSTKWPHEVVSIQLLSRSVGLSIRQARTHTFSVRKYSDSSGIHQCFVFGKDSVLARYVAVLGQISRDVTPVGSSAHVFCASNPSRDSEQTEAVHLSSSNGHRSIDAQRKDCRRSGY